MNEFNYTQTPLQKEVTEKVSGLKEKVLQYKNKETLKKIFSCIDLTSLNTADTTEKIKNMTFKVNNFNNHFPDYENVAAICVYPLLVPTVKENLKANEVKIASVGANFPSSQTFLSVKAAECELIVNKGANEVDIVISVGTFLEKEYKKIASEIQIIKHSIGSVHLKVILETGELKTIENIHLASIIAMESGADFIKTSTGKTPVSATPEAIYTMCSAIKDFYNKTGKKIGIKPSGGMTISEDAIIYYLIIKEVLGEEWLNKDLLRFGASRLANNILTDLNRLNGINEIVEYF
jgi:deoxyribose-phosphate aldolase